MSLRPVRFARMLSFCGLTLVLPSPILALDPQQPLSQMHHTSWTAKDGLAGAAQCLAQTADGHLWVGTSDGLFRFDGVQFERVQPERGELAASSVSALMAVPDGGLWMGYSRGGASFLGADGAVVNYAAHDGLPVGKVRSFARDAEGAVWVGAIGGVARLEAGRWRMIRMDWNFPCLSAWRFFVDRQGTLWVAGASPNRILFLPKGVKKFQDTGIDGSAFALAQAADGTIVFQDQSLSIANAFSPAPGRAHDPWPLFDSPGQQLILDRGGSVWVAGFDIVRVRLPERVGERSTYRAPLAVERFSRADGLSGSIASDVLEDREGNVWVTTEGGLDRFRTRNLSWTAHRDRTASVSLLAGDNGSVWALSTWDPTILRVQDRTIVPGAPKAVRMGYRDPDGAIWIGGETFWQWKDGRFLEIDPPDAVRSHRFPFHVTSATMDRAGRLWVSIGGLGEFHRKDGKWTFVKILPDRPDMTAVAALTDAADRVWLAYRDELAVVEGGAIRVFSAGDGLAVGALLALAGRDRQIWVGGESGLAFLRGDRFHQVRAAGSGFGPVNGIVVRSQDGVWLSAGAGIVHVSEAEIQSVLRDPAYRVRYEVLDLVSDLPEPLLTHNSGTPITGAVEGTDGLLWFVTTHGVARVDPQRIVRNPLPPPVVIRSVVADDRAYSPRGTVALPALTKTIRIDYTAPSLSIPERVQFRYRLDGWETEWHDAGARRTAFYTQLGPGTYGFRVLASNNDGVWNEVGATLAFAVAPAWYQTIWFRGLVAALAVALLLSLYRFRVRQVAAALSVRFDERLAERTRIAGELHDTLLQTVQAGKMVADSSLAHAADAARMHRAMEQVSVWLGQAVHEGRAALQSLRSPSLEAHDLAEAFRQAAESAAKPATMTVSVSATGDAQDLHPMARDEVCRIGYEAIRNACAHSGGTTLDIEVDYGRDLTVRVSDNGAGIDPVVADQGKEGHFGLRGMRDRAARIGAALTIARSAPGTRITLVVPGGIAFRRDPSTAPRPPADDPLR